MPTLTTRDFQCIAHKGGNVFFNQNSGRLDTRGGSFLSRVVTWIKSKYSRDKVTREYKMASNSFMAEVRQIHNKIFREYDPQYKVNENDLRSFYQLGGSDTPLAMRQVRQVLKNLETVPEALKLAHDYFSVEYCQAQLVAKARRNSKYYRHYTPNQAEIERLSGRIKEAIVNEIYRQEGMITEEDAESIALEMIADYAQSPTVKMAIEQSDLGKCEAQISKGMAEEPTLYKHFTVHATDIENLGCSIKDAIIERSQDEDITKDAAAAIAHQMIEEHVGELLSTIEMQKALYEAVIKEHSDKIGETELDQTASLETAETFNVSKPAQYKPLPMQESASVSVKQANTDAQTKVHIPELPDILKQQLSSRQIDSKEKLIQASNQYVAGKTTRYSFRKWYVDLYKKVSGQSRPPKIIPGGLMADIKARIASSPTLVTYNKAEEYIKQEIANHIASQSK